MTDKILTNEDMTTSDREQAIEFDPSAWQKGKSGKTVIKGYQRLNFNNKKYGGGGKRKSVNDDIDEAKKPEGDEKKKGNSQIEFVTGNGVDSSTASGSAHNLASGRKLTETSIFEKVIAKKLQWIKVNKNTGTEPTKFYHKEETEVLTFNDLRKRQKHHDMKRAHKKIEEITQTTGTSALDLGSGDGPVNIDKVHSAGDKPHEEKWVSVNKKKKMTKEGKDMKTYKEFITEMEFGKDGVYRHKGTYGSAKGAKYGNTDYDNEHLDKEDDEAAPKQAASAGPKKRGRPFGAKSGANHKVTTGKKTSGADYTGYKLHLPNSNR